MNAGQYEGILGRLDAILAKMPAAPVADSAPTFTVHHLDGSKTVTSKGPTGPVRTGWPHECPGPAPVHTARISVTAQADKLAGAVKALAAMERAAKGWAEGAAENDEAMGRRDRKPSDQQPFVLADILNMIDDAAREVGVAPVYSERSEKP